MDPSLGSGDTQRSQPTSPRYMEDKPDMRLDDHFKNETSQIEENEQGENSFKPITPQNIEDHEIKLKNRIDQCRSVIESLKLELNEEKAKLEKDTKDRNPNPPNWRLELDEEKAKIEKDIKSQEPYTTQITDDFINSTPGLSSSAYYKFSSSNDILGDFSMCTNMYSACVDSRLGCDENLMEYERQLEKYQTTLNRAQAEKKSAIRKRMLTKAYKLKLMELENQCNIELLRVKQSLQCLEPLQMIVNQWKIGSDEGPEKFELMPCYPEISASSGIHIEAVKEEPSGSGDVDVLDIAAPE